jgi:hypothetical protein
MEINLIFMIAVLATTFSLITVILLVMFKNIERKRYDDLMHRAKLDDMREYFESQINKLTNRLLATEERWIDVNHLLISSINRLKEVPKTPEKAKLSEFLKSFNITEEDLEIEKDLIFVLTPFHREFEETFEIINKTCNKVGLRCLRGDEEFVTGELLPHILKLLVRARLVIANIDGRNPNVFYELGIAQAIDKPTILIAHSVPEMPFDIRTRKIITFKNHDELYQKLQIELTRTLVKRTLE